MRLGGWARYPVLDCDIQTPHSVEELRALIDRGDAIARGNGRAYGDSALSATNTIQMSRFNRMLAFDDATGQLIVEAGVMLSDIIDAFLPRGWFPPVTPGTKFVTIGGMIAADVHGKNHHVDGSFRRHVDWIDLVDAGGGIVRCSAVENPDLFNWTLGGMGLTGIVLRAAFRLRPVKSGWIRGETIVTADLDATMDAFERTLDWTYSVAWIDCFARGRSILSLGEHALTEDLGAKQRKAVFPVSRPKRLSIPFSMPPGLMNNLAILAFNEVYFQAGRRRSSVSLVDWDRFFYPLDAIGDWNRLYGRRGPVQFQCVLPNSSSRAGLWAILDKIRSTGQGCFLAVLKRFGAQEGGFSFPMEGYTLALDFNVSQRSLALMAGLDRIVMDHGGRHYLAKDSLVSKQVFDDCDDRGQEFRRIRRISGAAEKFNSAQSRRLGL